MNRNEKGFTLLEIIVALTILSLGFLALVQLFSGGLRLATHSDGYLRGMVLAQNQFQRLEAVDFETETLQGEFEGEEGYFWKASLGSYSSGLRDSALPVKKVDLRVYWNQDGREKEIQLVSVATVGTTRSLTAKQLSTGSVNTASQQDPNEPETSAENNPVPTNSQQPESTSAPGGSLGTGK